MRTQKPPGFGFGLSGGGVAAMGACFVVACVFGVAPLLELAISVVSFFQNSAQTETASDSLLGGTNGVRPPRLPGFGAIAMTGLWAGGIAAGAAVLGVPLACWWRRGGALVMLITLLPAIVPAYLAYAGWGQLRAPGTALGDAIATGPSWVSITVGRSLAVFGLAVWAAPIVAAMLGPSLRSFDEQTLEQARADGASVIRRAALVARIVAADIFGAWALVALLVLGSAVPLHLAQVDTLALRSWLELDQRPWTERGAAVIASWPLGVSAIVGAWWFSRKRWAIESKSVRHAKPWRWSWFVGGAVVLVGVGLPLVLFAVNAGSWAHVVSTARELWPSLRVSGAIAGVVGVVSVLVFVAAWSACDAGPLGRRLAALSALPLLLTMLLPGVLVAVGVRASVERWLPGAVDSVWAMGLAHLARFSAIPVLCGLAVSALDSQSERWARRSDGVGLTRFGALMAATWPSLLPAGLTIGAACAVLSLHEIEASVMLTPPGLDTLPRFLLNQLHFVRDQDLAATVVVVLFAGLAIVGFGALCAVVIRRVTLETRANG